MFFIICLCFDIPHVQLSFLTLSVGTHPSCSHFKYYRVLKSVITMYYVWQASKASENKLCVKDMELFSIPSSIVKQIPECSKVNHKK